MIHNHSVIDVREDKNLCARRVYGPYTVQIINGMVTVFRHGWRKGLYQEYDYARNLREVKFPGEFKAGRLPQ